MPSWKQTHCFCTALLVPVRHFTFFVYGFVLTTRHPWSLSKSAVILEAAQFNHFSSLLNETPSIFICLKFPFFLLLFFYLLFILLLHFRFWGTWAEHAIQLHRYTHGSVFCLLSPLHTHLAFLPRLSLPTSPSPSQWPSPFPPNRPQCLVLPSLCPCALIFHHPPMSENMQYFIFCSCVSLLRMMFSIFVHVPTKDTKSSFLIAA